MELIVDSSTDDFALLPRKRNVLAPARYIAKASLWARSVIDEFIIEAFEEDQLNCTYRTVTLFSDNDSPDNIFLLGLLVVVVIPVQERYDIGILLDRTRFPASHSSSDVCPDAALHPGSAGTEAITGTSKFPANLFSCT